MWVLSSESRGVEYASVKKSNCIKEMKRLQKDDIANGYVNADGTSTEKYYIEHDDSDFYEEGVQ